MADATVRLSSTQSQHLIELYHGHDALWNILCSPQYKDRNVRYAAYIYYFCSAWIRRGNHYQAVRERSIREVCYCLLWTVTVTVGCFWDVRVIPSTN